MIEFAATVAICVYLAIGCAMALVMVMLMKAMISEKFSDDLGTTLIFIVFATLAWPFFLYVMGKDLEPGENSNSNGD